MKNTVLIVDDSNVNILTLTNILNEKYVVYSAESGQDALKITNEFLPDVILLDAVMPDMDEYNVLSALKASERTKKIPVILIIGQNYGGEEKGFAMGAADFITKPFAAPLVKIRVKNQIKLGERKANKYDITKYKLANDALNIALWDMVIENNNPVNPSNTITYSQEFRALLGYFDENDFPNIVESWSNCLHEEDKHRVIAALSAHIADYTGRTPFNVEYRLKMRNGEYRHFHAFGTTLRNGAGVPLRIAGALMDIEERVKTEQARDALIKKLEEHEIELQLALDAAKVADQAKDTFLAKINHELRTPMNSIIGFTELALDDDVSPKTADFLEKIINNAKWLLKIINDLLDISKIESGKMSLEMIEFNLHEIFSHCQSVILPIAKSNDVQLYCYAEPTIGKVLVGDPARLTQVLINILSNSVKFTSGGIVKFLASFSSLDENKATVFFEIKDNGLGMTAEQIKHIFEPFVQAENSVYRKFGGTGLGLTISKEIVEAMGGTLNVESTPGVGSKFTFEITFDVINVPDVEEASKQSPSVINRPCFDAEVLICEDNSMNQQVICEHLTKIGIKPTIAHNGKIGVDIVKERAKSGEKPFSLIFMDIHMPVMNGLEASAAICEAKIETPIVALTANIIKNDINLYYEYGIKGFLGKPFTAQELWVCLMNFLKPVSITEIDSHRNSFENDKTMKALQLNFVKENQETYENIEKAIHQKDFKLAKMIVHTLKSNAAQINENELRDAALAVEKTLASNCVPENLNDFSAKLKSALDKLSPMLAEQSFSGGKEKLSCDEMREFAQKLAPLLRDGSIHCFDLLDEIRSVEGFEELIKQIEDYEFEKALSTLKALEG